MSEPTAAFLSSHEQLATVYAKALLGAARQAGALERVAEEFDSVARDVLPKLPQLEAALSSPRVPVEGKLRLLDQAFGGKMHKSLLDFLKITARRGRLDALRAIHESFVKQYHAESGVLDVGVRSATPLGDEQRRLIEERLRAALGVRVILHAVVDPELLGGVVIRVGDTLYDGSLATRLEKLRAETIQRVTLEIRQALEKYTAV